MDGASDNHKRLFKEYLPALQRSTQVAEERWNGLVEGLMERTGVTRERALRDIRATSRAGPGEESEFIATVRRYWLKCAEVNDTVPEQQRVPPEEFILKWPAEAGATGCLTILAQLTYLPVGLNKEGRWV
jgi:hypothetical protein